MNRSSRTSRVLFPCGAECRCWCRAGCRCGSAGIRAGLDRRDESERRHHRPPGAHGRNREAHGADRYRRGEGRAQSGWSAGVGGDDLRDAAGRARTCSRRRPTASIRRCRSPRHLALPGHLEGLRQLLQVGRGRREGRAGHGRHARQQRRCKTAGLKLRASCDACHALYLRPYESPKVLDSDKNFDFDSAFPKNSGRARHGSADSLVNGQSSPARPLASAMPWRSCWRVKVRTSSSTGARAARVERRDFIAAQGRAVFEGGGCCCRSDDRGRLRRADAGQCPTRTCSSTTWAFSSPRLSRTFPTRSGLRFFEANVLSGVRLSRHYVKGMRTRNFGRIVFVSSESGVQIPTEMIHYGVTKTAQIAVARGLAETLVGHERHREQRTAWAHRVGRCWRIRRAARGVTGQRRCGRGARSSSSRLDRRPSFSGSRRRKRSLR